jgi:hypothetical protein
MNYSYSYLLRNHFFTGSQSGYMYEILSSPSYDLVASGHQSSAYVEPWLWYKVYTIYEDNIYNVLHVTV